MQRAPGGRQKGQGVKRAEQLLADRKLVWAKGWGGQKEGWWAEGALGRGGALSRGAVGRGSRWAEEASGQREPVAELI